MREMQMGLAKGALTRGPPCAPPPAAELLEPLEQATFPPPARPPNAAGIGADPERPAAWFDVNAALDFAEEPERDALTEGILAIVRRHDEKGKLHEATE